MNTMNTMNRRWTCSNPDQGNDLKVLCVCSTGLLRSPTMARLLCRQFENVNPRAVGVSQDHALVPMDDVHLHWADVVLCADRDHFATVDERLAELGLEKEVHCLNVPDNYGFGDKMLESILSTKLDRLLEDVNDQCKEEGVESNLTELRRM